MNFKKKNHCWISQQCFYLKYVSKPTFISQKKFSENFAAIHEIKPVLGVNKPIYFNLLFLK